MLQPEGVQNLASGLRKYPPLKDSKSQHSQQFGALPLLGSQNPILAAAPAQQQTQQAQHQQAAASWASVASRSAQKSDVGLVQSMLAVISQYQPTACTAQRFTAQRSTATARTGDRHRRRRRGPRQQRTTAAQPTARAAHAVSAQQNANANQGKSSSLLSKSLLCLRISPQHNSSSLNSSNYSISNSVQRSTRMIRSF